MNTDFQVRYRCPHLQEFDPDPNIPVFLFYMNDVDPYAERCADRLPWLKHDVQLDRSLSPLFRMQQKSLKRYPS